MNILTKQQLSIDLTPTSWLQQGQLRVVDLLIAILVATVGRHKFTCFVQQGTCFVSINLEALFLLGIRVRRYSVEMCMQ